MATIPEAVGGAYRETLERKGDKMPVASPPRPQGVGKKLPAGGGSPGERD